MLIYARYDTRSMAEITLKGFKCERCGHIWVPMSEDKPRGCPKCKSPYWDKPRSAEWENRIKKKLIDETHGKRTSR